MAGVLGEEGGVGQEARGEGGGGRGGGEGRGAEGLQGMQLFERGGENALRAGLGAREAFEAGFGARIEAGAVGEPREGAFERKKGGLGGGDLADKEEFEFAVGRVFAGELGGAGGEGVRGGGGGNGRGRHAERPCALSVG